MFLASVDVCETSPLRRYRGIKLFSGKIEILFNKLVDTLTMAEFSINKRMWSSHHDRLWVETKRSAQVRQKENN